MSALRPTAVGTEDSVFEITNGRSSPAHTGRLDADTTRIGHWTPQLAAPTPPRRDETSKSVISEHFAELIRSWCLGASQSTAICSHIAVVSPVCAGELSAIGYFKHQLSLLYRQRSGVMQTLPGATRSIKTANYELK